MPEMETLSQNLNKKIHEDLSMEYSHSAWKNIYIGGEVKGKIKLSKKKGARLLIRMLF